MCYNMICADCLQYNRHFTCFVYIRTNWYRHQDVLKTMKLINVIHFTLIGFKLGVYSLKIALSCRNVSE